MQGELTPHRDMLIVHIDWSKAAPKRWMCRILPHDATPRIEAPRRLDAWCPALGDLARCIAPEADGALIGLDTPLGVPWAWAERADVTEFSQLIRQAHEGRWPQLFEVARAAHEIGLDRPFYPHRAGGTRLHHLVEGLGLPSPDALLRVCDAPIERGPRPCPIFWTMGANQVGKGAIVAWRDVLGPALTDPSVDAAIWPFDGPLDALIRSRRVVFCETYPGMVAVQLGLTTGRVRRSKRSSEARAAVSERLMDHIARLELGVDASLRAQIEDGFSQLGAHGEDAYDALIGALGMAYALRSLPRAEDTTMSARARRVEGWMLGKETL